MSQKTKTVFVLGAGFSCSAGAPTQNRIISEIFRIAADEPHVFNPNDLNDFKVLLRDTMGIPESMFAGLPLEDVFTPIDRCITDNMAFKNLSVDVLRSKRELVVKLIGKTLKQLLQEHNSQYVHEFARYLVANARHRRLGHNGEDRISVVTMNWDILVDNAIELALQREARLAVVDYCCYISSYDKHDNRVKPGLQILGAGGFNVKLIKLHGSLNWLQCPRCQRLYAKFGHKISMLPFEEVNRPTCRHCESNFPEHTAPALVTNLIMPTFLKDLSNPQYKVIWQNAGIEFSEAKRIVFIGYSLPQADFEMRQLLSRMVARDTEILVVDRGPKGGKAFKDLISSYEQFFGRKVKPFGNGASNYVIKSLR